MLGSPVNFCEVFNQLLYVYPKSPHVAKYWSRYNEQQEQFGGNPWIGVQLPFILERCGFKVEKTEITENLYDGRNIKTRNFMLDYWFDLLLSAAPALLESGKIDEKFLSKLKEEWNSIKSRADGILYFGYVKVRATTQGTALPE